MSTASLAQIRRQVTQAWIRTRTSSIEELATTSGRSLEEIRSLYPDVASVERDGLRALVDFFREVTWPALAEEMSDQPVAHRLTSAGAGGLFSGSNLASTRRGNVRSAGSPSAHECWRWWIVFGK